MMSYEGVVAATLTLASVARTTRSSAETSMNRIARHFPELMSAPHRFTAALHSRLQRTIVHALRGRNGSNIPLRLAVSDACRELRAAGWTDQAALDALAVTVEDAGRACGADKPSLLSGELRWHPIRAKVLAHATLVLSEPAEMLVV
jgi:hypothetical protein